MSVHSRRRAGSNGAARRSEAARSEDPAVQVSRLTERRWNRTIQAEGCSALPVLKTCRRGRPTRPFEGLAQPASQRYMCRVAEPSISRSPEGIALRHRKHCPVGEGSSCRCRPAYQAQAFSPRDRRTSARPSRTSPTPVLGAPTPRPRCARARCAPPPGRRSRRRPTTGSPRRRRASPGPARATPTSPRPSEATRRRCAPRSSPSSGDCASRRSTVWRSRTWSTASSPGDSHRAPSATPAPYHSELGERGRHD